MAKVLLMNAGEYSEHDYNEIETDKAWNYYVRLADEGDESQLCDVCGEYVRDGQEWYRSYKDDTACDDCIQIVAIEDLATAWRKVHEPQEV